MTLCLLKSEMFVSFTMIQTIQRDLCTDAARVVFPLRIKCITYIQTLSKPIRALVPVCGHNLSVFPIILSGLWSHPFALPHASPSASFTRSHLSLPWVIGKDVYLKLGQTPIICNFSLARSAWLSINTAFAFSLQIESNWTSWRAFGTSRTFG